jgi:membrane-associated phospholipid phosphatase
MKSRLKDLAVSFNKAAPIKVGLLCLLFAAPLSAEDNPLKWASKYQPLADHLSTATVAVNVGAQTIASLRAPDSGRAFLQQGCETGFVVLVSEVGKWLVHRTRPDGSDNKSWPSEHTAVAGANVRWAPSVAIPLAAFTGYGRMAANKHHFSDVASGAGLDFLARSVCGFTRRTGKDH